MEEENKNVEENVQPVETSVEEVKPIEAPVEEPKPVEEKPTEVKKKSNKAQLLIVVVIMLLFVFGCGLYLGKQLFENKNKQQGPVNNINTENVEKPDPVNNNVEPEPPVEEDTKSHKSLKEVDADNVETIFTPQFYNSDYGLVAQLQSDGKTVKLFIDAQTIKNVYDIDILISGEKYMKTITFDKNVKQVFLGGYGHAVGQEILFFVMDDGTVKSVPFYGQLRKIDEGEIFNNIETIEGVTNVVYLYNLTVEKDGHGYYSVGAARKDGTFYDIFEFIYK